MRTGLRTMANRNERLMIFAGRQTPPPPPSRKWQFLTILCLTSFYHDLSYAAQTYLRSLEWGDR